MPREYKPRCCKDKALAVALFEGPCIPAPKRRKRPATVKGKSSYSETTNKATVVIPTRHPKGRVLKKKTRVSVRLNENVPPKYVATYQMHLTTYFTVYPINVVLLRMFQKIERRSPRMQQQAQSRYLLEGDTVGCKSRISTENGQRVCGVPKNKTKRLGGVETDQLQQLHTTLVRIIAFHCTYCRLGIRFFQLIEKNRLYLYISLQRWPVLQAVFTLSLTPAGDSGRWYSEL